MRTLTVWVAIACCACGDDDSGDGIGSRPDACSPVLGESCSASTQCDLGLTCNNGVCECAADTCALACWTDRTAADLVVDGDDVLALTRPINSPQLSSWTVTDLALGGGTTEVASGSGAALIAAHAASVYIAQSGAGGSSVITRRNRDGSAVTELKTGLPQVHAITASTRGIAYSTDRTIYHLDHTGATLGFLAAGAQENVPLALTFYGTDDFYYINHGVGTSDSVVRNSAGTRTELGTQTDIESLAVCTDAVYWTSSTSGLRYDRTTMTPDPFGGNFVGEVACDGTTVHWLGRDPDNLDLTTSAWIIGERTTSGTSAAYVVPYSPLVYVPQQISLHASFIVWSLAGQNVHRVMRTTR